MTRRGARRLAIIGLTVVAGIGIYMFVNRDIVVAYRLSVKVEQGGKTYTGSGVIAVHWRATPLLDGLIGPPKGGQYYPVIVGEAIAVRLDGPTVFVAMLAQAGNRRPPDLPQDVFADEVPQHPRAYEDYLRALASAPGVRKVPSDLLPPVTWFPNPTDPKSARCPPNGSRNKDNPSEPGDPRFVSAEIQMVHELPTRGIEQILPWLDKPEEFYHRVGDAVRNSDSNNGIYNCILVTAAFRQGM